MIKKETTNGVPVIADFRQQEKKAEIIKDKLTIAYELQELSQLINKMRGFELYADPNDWEEWRKDYYYELENYLEEAKSSLIAVLTKIDDFHSHQKELEKLQNIQYRIKQ